MKKILSIIILATLLVPGAINTACAWSSGICVSLQNSKDKAAKFPEGNVMDYVIKKLNLSKEEIGKGGKIIVNFIVTKDGDVMGVKFEESYSKIVDAKVYEIFRTMPKWTPAEKDGVKVDSYHSMPITIKS